MLKDSESHELLKAESMWSDCVIIWTGLSFFFSAFVCPFFCVCVCVLVSTTVLKAEATWNYFEIFDEVNKTMALDSRI